MGVSEAHHHIESVCEKDAIFCFFFFFSGRRKTILVVKHEISCLGSACKCHGLMVGVHVFGAHTFKASILFENYIWREKGKPFTHA